MSSPAAITVTDAAPTVATAAAASPSPATGTTAGLSVLGADGDGGGEANLSYTWSTTGSPPAAVNFSANGSNAAKNTTATFTAAGTYNFLVTITDQGGQSTTSAVSVTVNQTLASIAVSPSMANITAGGTQQFTVSGQDQFGQPITNPSVTWSVTGPGSLSGDGLYTPAYAAGTATVTATSGAVFNTASVTVTGEAQWNSATDASWGAAGAWADSVSDAAIAAPGVRGIAGDTVLFAAATGGTVTLDGASPALAGITFDNSTTSYTVAAGTGGSIMLQTAYPLGGSATVSVFSGNHAIAAPLVLAAGANFYAIAGTRLTIGGNISGSGGLTKGGSGVVELSGTNSYGGGTAVAAGKLIVNDASALPDGGDLTIGDGSFFAIPSASVPLAAATPQVSSGSSSSIAAATTLAPATVAAPAAASAAIATRATILSRAAAATMVPARADAAWEVRFSAPAAGEDAYSSDQNARIRDAIFADYERN